MLVKEHPEDRKKILIHIPKNPGGKLNYFLAIQRHFSEDVTYYYCGSQGRKESVPAMLRRLYQDYRRFYRLLKNGGYDLVHINPTLDPKSFFRESIYTWISCWLGIKTLVFWHGWRQPFADKVVSKIKAYFRGTYGKADAMIFLAREFADQARAYGYQKKTYLETTVVEDDILEFQQQSPSPDRNTDNEKIILFLSRIEKAKGIYEMLDSFRRLQVKFPDLILQIAGEGGELAAVKEMVRQEGLKNVIFLGWVNGAKKAAVFHRANIYVLPSYSEGMPCSILEAMASGLPVITTDVGGIKDFFVPGQMGYFVRPRSGADLEEKISKLLSDPLEMQRIGASNARYALANFSARQVCRKIEHIYNELIMSMEVEADVVKA